MKEDSQTQKSKLSGVNYVRKKDKTAKAIQNTHSIINYQRIIDDD